jgi:hypothetical protein
MIAVMRGGIILQPKDDTSHPLSYLFLRAPSGVDPPEPIPNSEVKHASADDTWRATAWESRSARGLFKRR